MTPAQFEAVASLISSREPVKSAARLVLVDGIANAEAAREFGLSPQSVSNTVGRFLTAEATILTAYRLPEDFTGNTRSNVYDSQQERRTVRPILQGRDMSYDPVARLMAHAKKLNQLPSTLHWLELLRLARLLIEYKEISSAYPVLAAYCNWMLHANLDRNSEALKVLEMMNRALRETAMTKDIGSVLEKVSLSFRLAELRLQLLQLLDDFKIDSSWMKRGWPKFLNALLDDLCERPIAFLESVTSGKGGPGKAIFESIVAAHSEQPEGWNVYVISVYISRVEHSVPGRPAGHYWNATFLQHDKRVSLNGHLEKP